MLEYQQASITVIREMLIHIQPTVLQSKLVSQCSAQIPEAHASATFRNLPIKRVMLHRWFNHGKRGQMLSRVSVRAKPSTVSEARGIEMTTATTITAATTWIVLANDHQARLLSARRTPTGRCQVVEREEIESPIPTRDRGRPSALNGMSGHSYADNLRALKEERRRFARQLARWIDEFMKRPAINKLTVFAPSRMIGSLREVLSVKHRGQIQLIDENLINMPSDALRRHHAITRLVGLHRAADGHPTSTVGLDMASSYRPTRYPNRGARRHIPIHETPRLQ